MLPLKWYSDYYPCLVQIMVKYENITEKLFSEEASIENVTIYTMKSGQYFLGILNNKIIIVPYVQEGLSTSIYRVHKEINTEVNMWEKSY